MLGVTQAHRRWSGDEAKGPSAVQFDPQPCLTLPHPASLQCTWLVLGQPRIEPLHAL